jgi:hypothetical protein
MTLTDAELLALELQARPLPVDPPWQYAGISQTQLSVARHAGGAVINGWTYVYDARDDSLTRGDVHRIVMAMRRLAEKVERTARKEAAKAAQGGLL